MALIVRYEPTGHKIDLEHATEEDMAIIRELHNRPNGIHRGGKLLTCLKDWEAEQAGQIPPIDREMTVKYLASYNTWFAAHLAGGSHGSHKIIQAESLAHRRQKEYWCTAAQSVGLQARTEVKIDGGTLDVAITGLAVATDIECQRSTNKERKIAHRTRVYDKAGYLPVWFNAASGQRPQWLRTVPFLGHYVHRLGQRKALAGHSARDRPRIPRKAALRLRHLRRLALPPAQPQGLRSAAMHQRNVGHGALAQPFPVRMVA